MTTEATDLTPEQVGMLKHTLGADSRYTKKEWGFRNHYCVSVGTPDHDLLQDLESKGYMVMGRSTYAGENSRFYRATRKACELLGFSARQIGELSKDGMLPKETKQ